MGKYVIKEVDDFKLKFKKDYEDILDFDRLKIVKAGYGYFIGENNLILLETTSIFNYKGVYVVYNVAREQIEKMFYIDKFNDNFKIEELSRKNILQFLYTLINFYEENDNYFLEKLSENFKISYNNFKKRKLGLSMIYKHYCNQMKKVKKKLPKEVMIQNVEIEKTRLCDDVEITGTFFTKNHKITKPFKIKGLTKKIRVVNHISKKKISEYNIEKHIEDLEKYLKALKKDKEIFENFDAEKFLEENIEPFKNNKE